MTKELSHDQSAAVAVANLAIGEALFASALATVMLTGQIASGRMAVNDAETLLDGAMLVLEHHRGTVPDDTSAIDHALQRLRALLLNLLTHAAPAESHAAAANANRPSA
jgi:hypothetical protein